MGFMRLGLFENREKLVKHEVPKMKFAIWGRSTSYFQTRPNPCISQYEVPLNCHEIQMISSCLDDFPTLSPQKKHIQLVVWNMYFIVHSVGNVIIPTDDSSIIFQRGDEQPPTRYLIIYYYTCCDICV